MITKLTGILVCLFLNSTLLAQQTDFEVKSPDGLTQLKINTGDKLQWSVWQNGQQIILPSSISMELGGGEILGDRAQALSSSVQNKDTIHSALNYKKSKIKDTFSQLTLNCKGDFGVIFRVYNSEVAYRFFTHKPGELVIKNEEVTFNFAQDFMSFIPYMWDYRAGKIFNTSYEALYREGPISKFAPDSLAFLPLLVDVGQGKKVAILEADLEDYPGLFLNKNQTEKGFSGVFAPLPLETKIVERNVIPTKRADYIARTTGSRQFPWRAIVISSQDKELLNNDLVQKLAAPSRLNDVSWIKPGLSAWDWWNDWNISHVDFKAGYNTPTYKYYIDFAAANKIPYIIMDEGWSETMDLTKVSSAIDLREIIDYGKKKKVGVILWATWFAVTQQMETVFPLYSKMGVKGFKIDFIDRDDQIAVASTYEIAKKAAEYQLLVDYHGVFKPTGLQKTWPNVIGYEGVKGLENYKWAVEDAPRYAVSIPFIRMLAGPMDYTPGAMRNSIRSTYKPTNSAPMSQGTRCHQMAMYVVYEVPFQILADNPTIYTKEQECTSFITSIPTTYEETIALDGKVGEYVAIARKKGKTWFVGAMSNWDGRELSLDFSFLGKGKFEAEIFRDGINADRDATDYKKETLRVSSGDKLKIRLAPGGGWIAKINPLK